MHKHQSKKNMAWWQFILLILFFIGIYLAYLYVQQRSLIYYPNRTKIERTRWQATDFQEVKLHTADNLILTAWYKPAVKMAPTLIYFPGNSGNIGARVERARPYLALGWGVILVSYRGYGGNPGVPTETGLYQDAEAAFQYLKQQNISDSCMVLLGTSLGSGVAVELAQRHPKIGAVVLHAPYTNLVDLGSYHYPWLPVKWLLKDRYESLAKIKSIHSPLLILHGEKDNVIPIRYGRRLYEAANSPKEGVFYKDLGHDEFFHPEAILAAKNFVDKFVRCFK